jgi:hypothetical protein
LNEFKQTAAKRFDDQCLKVKNPALGRVMLSL